MTPDEIIVLANKAGWDVLDLDDGFGIRLKEFAALVEKQATALEREACAKVCDAFESEADPEAGSVLAKAIRGGKHDAR